MAIYILLTSLTPLGLQTLHQNPTRLKEVNEEVEEFGCKLLAQYATLGGFDFVNVVEAPDNETVAHLSVDLGSRGTVTITTLPAIPVEDFVKKLTGPEQMGRSR